jgi:hypothetical protein
MSAAGTSLSVQSGRNFTSPFTNLTWFSDIEAGVFLAGVQRAGLPLAALPGFLHEATHHWCFNFTAGTSAALLYRRALRDAVPPEGSGGVSGAVAQRLTYSMMRVEAFLAVQQPLAEGLALFAEFDLFATEDPKARCLPVERAMDLFSQSIVPDDELGSPPGKGTPARLNAMLNTMHLEPVALRRKTDVLLLPIDAPDGYLAGYLLVKQLWFLAMTADSRLEDPQLFMTYLTWFVYADLGLVARLLDDTPDVPTVLSVIEYFTSRLKAFLTTEHARHVDQLLAYRVPGRVFDGIEDWTRAQPELSVDPELAAAGRSRFLTLYDDVLHSSAASRSEITQADLDSNIFMFQRRLIALARLPVRLETDADGNVAAYSDSTLLLNGTATASELFGTTTDGLVEVLIDDARGYIGIVVVAVDTVIGSWFSADAPAGWRADFLAFRADLSKAYEHDAALLAWLKDSTRSAAPWLYPLEVARDQGEDAAIGTYGPLAAMLLRNQGLYWGTARDDGDFADIVTRLSGNGLLAPLERIRYVRAAAWGSLAAPRMAAVPDAVAAVFRMYRDFHRVEESFSDTMVAIQSRGIDHIGHPLWFFANGQLRFAI